GRITENFGTLTTGQANTSTTFSGIDGHIGDLNKVGSGTFTISGVANTYAGTTNINAGVVALSPATAGLNIAALGHASTGTVVAAGAALQVTTASQFGTEALTLNGTGINNAGALRKTGNNLTTYTGAITINTDGARINSDSNTLRITGILQGN